MPERTALESSPSAGPGLANAPHGSDQPGLARESTAGQAGHTRSGDGTPRKGKPSESRSDYPGSRAFRARSANPALRAWVMTPSWDI